MKNKISYIYIFIAIFSISFFATCKNSTENIDIQEGVLIEAEPLAPERETNASLKTKDTLNYLLSLNDEHQLVIDSAVNEQKKYLTLIRKKDMLLTEIEDSIKHIEADNKAKKEKADKKKPNKDKPKKVKPLDTSSVVIDSLTKELSKHKAMVADYEKKKSMIDQEIDKLRKKMPVPFTELQAYIKRTNGAKVFYYQGTKYFAYIADLSKETIRMHWKNPKKKGRPFNRFSAVAEYLRTDKKEIPLMITNGGMFSPNYAPQGLLIADSIQVMPLDTGNFPEAGNFYLMPNGVFSVDKKGIPSIDTTQGYELRVKSKKYKPMYATQSGPMLVINGRIHGSFTKGSANRKIRSGVGIISDKKVAFILSINPANFYDFSYMYREVFGCKYALFLDGAISQMYLKDVENDDINGNFGPIISISKKMKK
jgi:uncharacterized protein YigE (DUF2233 family)